MPEKLSRPLRVGSRLIYVEHASKQTQAALRTRVATLAIAGVQQPRCPSARQSIPNAGKLDLREFFDRIAHPLTTNTGSLHSAEGIQIKTESTRLINPK
jgi:hypothetical protein